jgi:hypothetical protein
MPKIQTSMRGGEPVNELGGRGFLVTAGVCAILWAILADMIFFALYPVVAGGAMLDAPGGFSGFATRWAELGQRQTVVALEWSRAAVQLLLLPFLLALYRLLSRVGQRDLMLVAVGLSLMVFTGTFHPALTHSLAQAYVDAKSEAEKAALLSTLYALFKWYEGLNQVAALLYVACVGLVSLAMILSRTWRIWGWVGIIGAFLALPAKLSLGLVAPSNACWTGWIYLLWPIALGIGLLRYRERQVVNPQ